MSDFFKQVGDKLRDNKETTELNSRRVSENFPYIESKVDNVHFASPYVLEFFTSGHPHSIKLNLYVRPPVNCFQCQLGPAVNEIAAAAILSGVGPEDGDQHPIIYSGFSSNPTNQYTIDPSGGIVVPISGTYNVNFQAGVFGVAVSEIAAVVASVRVNGVIVVQKVWSVANNLLGAPPSYINVGINLYGLCMFAQAGDIVGGYIGAGGIAFYGADPGGLTSVSLIALA